MIVRENKTLVLDGRVVHDSQTMEACYRERHLKYGWSSGALFYSRPGLHEKRLHQAEDFLHHCLKSSDSFLDAGCGFGELIPYIPSCRYHGVDIILNFVEEARRRYPEYAFIHADMMTHTDPYDWVAMVGVSGTMPRPEEKICHCCSLAQKGILLDILDADKYEGGYNRFQKEEVYNLLRRQGFADIDIADAPGVPWTFFCGKR